MVNSGTISFIVWNRRAFSCQVRGMATARYVNKINGTVVVTSTRKNKIYEKLSASTFYMETLLLQMYAHYHSFILSEEY